MTPRLSLRRETEDDIRHCVAEPEPTVVLACPHVRRDPETWQSRAGI
jgi:hypothetical protein